MPELPEVEIVRRGLAPAMEGSSFLSVTLNREDLRFPFDANFARRLKSERVIRLSRRAKYIIAETGSGLGLAMHLGMTGRFTILRQGLGQGETPGAFYYDYDADPRHDHVVFAMSGGDVIRYNDVRRFGYMTLLPIAAMDAHPHFKGLGVEPLSDSLTPDYLIGRARGKSQALKAFLLDQRIIAGLGNIYVCEALFRAGLPPEAEAGVLALGKGAARPRNASACPSRPCSAMRSWPAAPRSATTGMPMARAAASRKNLTSMAAPGSLVIGLAVRLSNAKSSRGARLFSVHAANPKFERKHHGF